MNDQLPEYARNLRRFREGKKLGVSELGRLAGVSGGVLRMYEAGIRMPKVETAGRLAKALGVELRELDLMGFGGGAAVSVPSKPASGKDLRKMVAPTIRVIFERGEGYRRTTIECSSSASSSLNEYRALVRELAKEEMR